MSSPLAPQQHAFRQDQLYLVLYLDQEYAGTRQNQGVVYDPNHGESFGLTVVNDWAIYDGPDPSKAKIVARARGHHVQSCKDFGGQWFLSCSIIFLDESSYVHFSSWFCASALLFLYLLSNLTCHVVCQAILVPHL